MKIAIWKTGHGIASNVADAVYVGLCRSDYNAFPAFDTQRRDIPEVIDNYDVHIGYGILRGMDEVFRECDRQGKPWFNIDRGYFQPGHYDGYYRISLCGTQQTIGLDKLEPDYERFAQLNYEVSSLNHEINENAHTLIVPPTEAVTNFFNKSMYKATSGYFWYSGVLKGNILRREKGCERPLQKDLENCSRAITFNSSIGWEALRQGIPVVSDPDHSIVGAWQKMVDKPLHLDSNERHKLFAVMGDLQMTLEEIRNGRLCTLLPKLLKLYNPAIRSTSILAGTHESPSLVTWRRTA